jgi:cytochrome o ubiquinol oxidase operon protein cyoD
MSHANRLLYVGFGLSLILTLAAFGLVMARQNSDNSTAMTGAIVAVLSVLAIGQLLTQLIFFFHLSHEERPRLNSTSFTFMAIVVALLIGGSLWIMYNLHENMAPGDVSQFIQQDENIHKDMNMGG